MKIKAGTILVPESGCYDGYKFHGPFRVVDEFNQLHAVMAYKAARSQDPDAYETKPKAWEFLEFLETAGIIEPAPDTVIWDLGADVFEPEIQEEPS